MINQSKYLSSVLGYEGTCVVDPAEEFGCGQSLKRGRCPTASTSNNYRCQEKENERISIVIRDNGNGIRQEILDKIFQPFFTTKPAGQGTGLGLSLSYDIVKAQGGELKVYTKEGTGAEFIIQLSVNNR
jgi:signal transduction histidine kinase